ncbi:MAG: hypothetical protein GYB64_12290 [Chloroflexi bacterium]|nr:hypothetical protein [Chloroflexota bacterium]
MPYETFWDDAHPDTIIIKATPPKDWESFHLACGEAIEMATAHGKPLGVIFDVTNAPEPAGKNTLLNLRTQAARLPTNIHAVVVVGYSTVGRTFLDIIGIVFGERYRAVDTLDEAYDIVAERVAAAR